MLARHSECRSAFAPAGVVAQVSRDSPRQHALLRLRRSGAVRIDPLTDEVTSVGADCSAAPARRTCRPLRPTACAPP
ncbi:MAG: hypothetical protein BGP03_02785 [Pseudonocardia sp. 73-21]|nr:MAG: hypothetical protein BGP03_02785 [Pseudonocardia sp. 73-21]